MSNRVPADKIEQLVGSNRHATSHLGFVSSRDQIVYILHSYECRDSTPDLRTCPFSLALDRGIDPAEWTLDESVTLIIKDNKLEQQRRPDE